MQLVDSFLFFLVQDNRIIHGEYDVLTYSCFSAVKVREDARNRYHYLSV